MSRLCERLNVRQNFCTPWNAVGKEQSQLTTNGGFPRASRTQEKDFDVIFGRRPLFEVQINFATRLLLLLQLGAEIARPAAHLRQKK